MCGEHFCSMRVNRSFRQALAARTVGEDGVPVVGLVRPSDVAPHSCSGGH